MKRGMTTFSYMSNHFTSSRVKGRESLNVQRLEQNKIEQRRKKSENRKDELCRERISQTLPDTASTHSLLMRSLV